jgi:hypothetical protein
MKKLIYFGLVFVSLYSCKREVTVEQVTTVQDDGTTVTTTKTTTDYDFRLRKAEDDYNRAETEASLAREHGDTQAERAARETAAKAKEVWEATKAEIRDGASKGKEALNNTKESLNKHVQSKDTIIVKKNK